MMNLTPRINRLEPNVVIDGGMEAWPEGTSRSITTSSDLYGSVLFKNHNGSGVTLTVSRQTSVPSGSGLIYSSQLSKSVSGSLTAGTYAFKAHYIEGYNALPLINSEFSVIFWVKSSVASNRSLALQNTGFTHSLVKQYNIAQANTWELKAITFPALSTCPGTVNRENGAACRLVWSVVHGSTYQTATLGSWLSGLYSSGIGEDTTWLTGTNHDFSIAGVMVLPGDWSSLTSSGYQFVRAGRTIQEERSNIERYYEAAAFRFRAALTSGSIEGPVCFAVEKRATPTIVEDGPTETANNVHTKGFSVNSSSAAFTINWSADARF